MMYLSPYMNHQPLYDANNNILGHSLLFVRRWNKEEVKRQFMLKAANKVTVLETYVDIEIYWWIETTSQCLWRDLISPT